MKYTWENADPKTGNFVKAEGATDTPSITQVYQIGYRQPPNGPAIYSLNSIADGLVSEIGNRKALVDYLNENKYSPCPAVECIGSMKRALADVQSKV